MAGHALVKGHLNKVGVLKFRPIVFTLYRKRQINPRIYTTHPLKDLYELIQGIKGIE